MPRQDPQKKQGVNKPKEGSCLSCFFHWWAGGLKHHCFNPEIDKDIRNPKAVCNHFADARKKIMPNADGKYDHGYPDRLPIEKN